MPNDIIIALGQTPIVWESAAENCSRLSSVIADYINVCDSDRRPDILVLPEMFSTGFTMNPEAVQSERGPSLKWMAEICELYGIAVVGSVAVEEGGNVYNRCYFVSEDTRTRFYDKRHLFRMGKENDFYSAGDRKLIVNFRGWNVAINVCYDLRFPVWSRNVEKGYDLMINVANWPSSRIKVTEHLVKARAVENMSYYAFVNRVGDDPSNSYNGFSRIVSPKGDDIASVKNVNGVDFFSAELSYSKLLGLREKFPAWMDGDNFEINC